MSSKTIEQQVEGVEEEFNRLCTVAIEDGGFRRLNGTMDSYEQAIWLRKQSKEEIQERDRIAREEERDRFVQGIEFSDMTEEEVFQTRQEIRKALDTPLTDKE